ncbi:S8 family serine peptidase [Streptosporangium amethystogenes subsp. fukuiense]|uniref:S8 family serine peptidase n=1 Tax=Streptosporangium amethystogenes subsp. fukuiense TaxID=698418 RepID=A0ABW2TDV3_9ACTN
MRLRRLTAGAIALTAVWATLVATPVSALAAGPPPSAGPAIDPAVTAGVASGERVRAIVGVAEGQSVASVARSAEAASPETGVLPGSGTETFFVMNVDGPTLAALGGDRRVASVHEDRLSAPALASTTKVIGADRAYLAGATGAGQNIAILDSGIDRDHPFLAGRIVAEACFSHNAEEWRSRTLCPDGSTRQVGPGSADAETAQCVGPRGNLCGHGTHVAGIAAGKRFGKERANGVAPGAGIIAIQVFSRFLDEEQCGKGKAPCVLAWASDQLRALDYVIDLTRTHRIAAATMSVSQPGDNPYDENETCDVEPVSEEIAELLKLGVPTVIASGNGGYEGRVSVPGCVRKAVTVGATNDRDAMAPFSNRGILLDLLAPGVGVRSSVPGGGWATRSGTSMAAAHVAGAFALLRERSPEASPAELLARLQDTGKAVTYRNRGSDVTTKRIEVHAALGPAPSATPTPSPTPTATPSPSATPTTAPATSPPTTTPAATPSPDPTGTDAGPATPDPLPEAGTCRRGGGTKALTSARWAFELRRGSGRLSDLTLSCYLSLAQKGSKVFPEVTASGSLGSAYRVLKGRAGKAALDRELLAAWLNWAHGAYDGSSRVRGTTTLKSAIAAAERQRLNGKATGVQVAAATGYLQKHVNRAR